MIYEIDTDKLENDIAARIVMGFPPRIAILFAIIAIPPLVTAILRGLERGYQDAITKPSKEST